MVIEFSCCGCGRALRAPDGAAGRESRCPDCGNVAAVPTADSPLPELASAAAASSARNESSVRVKHARGEPNSTVRVVGGMIGVAVVLMVVVGVYGHRSNQLKAEERGRLILTIDELVSAATAKADVYDFDAAQRALDDAEKELGGSLHADGFFRDELSDKIIVARSSFEPLQAEYRSKIAKGWILFEGKLLTSSEHQVALSEKKKKEAEQTRLHAEAKRRRREELRRQREEETRRREAVLASERAQRERLVPVTKAEYDRIRDGMSYATVVSIIGKRGEELSRSHMGGVPGVMESITTVMYSWQNVDGSNMNAMFQNDRLVMKAQFGLR